MRERVVERGGGGLGREREPLGVALCPLEQVRTPGEEETKAQEGSRVSRFHVLCLENLTRKRSTRRSYPEAFLKYSSRRFLGNKYKFPDGGGCRGGGGSRVYDLGFLVSVFWFLVSGFGFLVSSFGLRISGFGFQIPV